jgi:hypothetical protein
VPRDISKPMAWLLSIRVHPELIRRVFDYTFALH